MSTNLMLSRPSLIPLILSGAHFTDLPRNFEPKDLTTPSAMKSHEDLTAHFVSLPDQKNAEAQKHHSPHLKGCCVKFVL